MDFICTYVNSVGYPSTQHLSNAKFDNQDEPMYVQGWSVNHDRPVTLRYDRVIQVFASTSEAEDALAPLKENLPEYSRTTNANYLSSPSTTDICFTGFKKADKEQLVSKAIGAEMVVRKDVVKHLDFLCYGYNAGPKKLEKALSQGVFILNQTQFETMLETGEVPEDI
ncbi:hypothetical protein B6A42_13260 [Vibrio coralliilyticus]|nr:hypothetical protein B6A42_13260 [Vibrio coralliilyticus]